jgi:tetratricopeptide (TPR) repeat protein/energy-coupling factor transporter ATP-binding protein EcfA2
MSMVEISDAAAHDATPGETATAAQPLPDDGTRLSNERPFPGLRPFGFGDRAFFFGRERQAFALYRLVENGRFIAVIGGSGSGKSSLVLAGLQGLLADETADTGGPTWAFLDMRPGGAPITRLARALSKLSPKDSPDESARRRDRIEWTLRQSSFSFESALREAGGLTGRSLILVVDQFEELFRFGLAGLGYRRGGVEEARRRDEATQFVQILLDADRRRIENVRVLITMRSDFIGDCANFHGLPEAVSATQYLVPNLTRSQLEEAIRKPIEKAGGTIEPELVERLLNDCGDELDQLPVLQHCLMRLWDRAGADTPAGSARHLTRKTYDEIGRMTDALSRHADEIFDQCPGKELAIEQAFRALSEVDREGRAIRRALRFDKLLAETGASESDLRAGLDQFRAPNCSFLLPSLSASPTLAADERIDIGHEALLRRWKKIAGKPDLVDPRTGRPPPGWLAEEQIDGQRYHTLVSLLDGTAGGERATLDDPERTKDWWEDLPRTAAWADRYGGKFDEVEKLIDDAIAAKRRSRLKRRLTVALFVACVLFGAAGIWAARERAQQRQIAQEKMRQEELDKSAMTSAKSLLEDVLKAYSDTGLDPAGAKSLANISGQFLDNVRQSSKTSAADLLWGQSLDDEADLYAILGNNAQSLTIAKQAKDVAQSLIQSNSSAKDGMQLLFDASIRVGNALVALGGAHKQDALKEYSAAVGIAEKIVSSSDDEGGDDDVIDAHMKIGDVYKDSELKQYSEARTEYQSGLATCLAALAKHPQSFILLRDKGKAFYRIAELLRTEKTAGTSDEARAFYGDASEVQNGLITRNAQEALAAQKAPDSSLKSNLAATYTHWGLLEKEDGNLELALEKLRQGAAIDEQLTRSEPGNPQWQEFLTPNYLYLAETLEGLKRPDEALAAYRKLDDARRTLAYRAPGRSKPQKEFAEAAKLLGDRSTGLIQIEAYREAVRTWNRLVEDPKNADVAAGQYDVVLGFARTFDAKKDWPDAQSAYRVAMKVAVLNYVKDPSATSWRDKAEEAERAAVVAGKAAESAPADPVH